MLNCKLCNNSQSVCGGGGSGGIEANKEGIKKDHKYKTFGFVY